jgi:hypothetical protein
MIPLCQDETRGEVEDLLENELLNRHTDDMHTVSQVFFSMTSIPWPTWQNVIHTRK